MSGTADPGGIVVALGDSITNGEGAPAVGVHCRSWAEHLARVADLPHLGLAADGAVIADVVAAQLPRLPAGAALAAVYVGVNDVRGVDFDPDAYAADLERVLAAAAESAERVVVCTIPLDLGRPRAGTAKVSRANRVIRDGAAAHGAVVAALDDLRGWRLVQADAVHPTALGQLEIADRAATALGWPVLPSRVVGPAPSRRGLARFALTGHVPGLVRQGRHRAAETVAQRRTARGPG